MGRGAEMWANQNPREEYYPTKGGIQVPQVPHQAHQPKRPALGRKVPIMSGFENWWGL